MPTPLDRAMQSRNAVLGFAGLVTAVAAWSIWGGDMFPAGKDPVGDPDKWADSELKRWLEVLMLFHVDKRGLLPSGKASREELVERVRANLRSPARAS